MSGFPPSPCVSRPRTVRSTVSDGQPGGVFGSFLSLCLFVSFPSSFPAVVVNSSEADPVLSKNETARGGRSVGVGGKYATYIYFSMHVEGGGKRRGR